MDIFIISLLNAVDRRNFQQQQLAKLGLDFEFLDAISVDNISAKTYKKHYNDWQRPLKNIEVACYFSHRLAWDKVIETNKPVLILEDDALLSKCTPEVLKGLASKTNIDLVTLENRGRKKFVAKSGSDIGCHSILLELFQDRLGAAGYVLWPSGAGKLIKHEGEKGIALADAHITSCYSLQTYQVEPTPIIQLDYRSYYNILDVTHQAASTSFLGECHVTKGTWKFKIKRLYSQIVLGIFQMKLILKSERRYIAIRKQDFL